MPRIDNTEAKRLVESRVEPYYEHPERLNWEHRMWRNFAFLSGIQSFSQDPYGGIHPVFDQNGVVRGHDFTANLINPKFQRAVSKITSLDLVMRVRPNSSSWKDIKAAKLASKVFRHVREHSNFEDRKNRAVEYAAAGGLGVLKITWDPDAGEKRRIYLKDAGELELAGLPRNAEVPEIDLSDSQKRIKDRQGQYRDIAPGDLRFEVVSPFSFYWDLDIKDADVGDMQWCSQVTILETRKVERRYGLPEGSIPPDTGLHGGTLFEQAVSLLHGGTAALGRYYDFFRGEHDRTRVVEYWEAPNSDNDWKGRRIVTAGDVLIVNGDNPYVEAGIDLPFVTFAWHPRPGTFVSTDLVGQLVDPQRFYNRGAQQLQKAARNNGWPLLVVPRGDGIQPHRFPNYAGPVLSVNAASPPPFQIPPAPMPPYIGAELQNRKAEMDEIAAQPPVTQGFAPGQVRGSSGIDKLLSAGNEVMNNTAASHASSVQRAGRLVLKLVGAYYDDQRAGSIIGEDGKVEIFQFDGELLRGNYNLIVDADSAQVVDKATRDDILIQLAMNGAIDLTNPHDKQALYKAIHLHTSEQFFDTEMANFELAHEENEQLLEIADAILEAGPGGIPSLTQSFPEARDFHDHRVHLEIHNHFRLTRQYRELPEQAQRVIDAHVNMHQEFASVQMQQELEIQMALGGKGKKPGTSPGPKNPGQSASRAPVGEPGARA